MSHDVFEYAELESRGFKTQSRLIIEKAIVRGKIFPQEISMILAGRAGSDRKSISTSVAWLAGALRKCSVSIATGQEAIAFRAERLPQHRERTPSQNGDVRERQPRQAGVRPTLPDYDGTPDGIFVDDGSGYAQDIDEAEFARVSVQALEANGAFFEYDALKIYYRDIGQYKLLSFEEEFQLGWLIREKNDMAALNTLVVHNLRLVRWVARKFTWSELPFEDLIQEGNIGLIIAAQKYDYRVGRFTTYATWWVRQRIQRAIMDYGSLIRIPVHMHELRRKVLAAASAVAFRVGRHPSVAEIAAESKIDESSIRQVMDLARLKVQSLDQPLFADNSNSSSPRLLADIVHDPLAFDGEHVIQAREERDDAEGRIKAVLDEIVSCRDERHYNVFRHFYGLDGSVTRRTLEETGAVFGVSRERIRQMIALIWTDIGDKGIDMDHESFLTDLSRIESLTALLTNVS